MKRPSRSPTTRAVTAGVRLRPLLPSEKAANVGAVFWKGSDADPSAKEVEGGDEDGDAARHSLYERKENGSASRWTFMDYLYGPHASTLSVFNSFVRPLLSCAAVGQNASIFAYGQTNSGKTFTIFGSPEARSIGIIGLAVADLFAFAASLQQRTATATGASTRGISRLFGQRQPPETAQQQQQQEERDNEQQQKEGKERHKKEPRLKISLSVVQIYQEVLSDLLAQPQNQPQPPQSKAGTPRGSVAASKKGFHGGSGGGGGGGLRGRGASSLSPTRQRRATTTTAATTATAATTTTAPTKGIRGRSLDRAGTTNKSAAVGRRQTLSPRRGSSVGRGSAASPRRLSSSPPPFPQQQHPLGALSISEDPTLGVHVRGAAVVTCESVSQFVAIN